VSTETPDDAAVWQLNDDTWVIRLMSESCCATPPALTPCSPVDKA